jgi:hypothetical protein
MPMPTIEYTTELSFTLIWQLKGVNCSQVQLDQLSADCHQLFDYTMDSIAFILFENYYLFNKIWQV